ncbi:TonB-dependent receptor plug domain-containing protein [Candidatus Marithrix sp. Canyon 246]|uniref:TonB-dependent receptor plug domain-containing protein n=1 Tax=Candidatus Marithrix sp. Canyon 246 TaxID=1827136 RepID=UPI00084A0C8A|nr:TonB-dependent receptor [Candidatus Marithrix sp. Canyon 246]
MFKKIVNVVFMMSIIFYSSNSLSNCRDWTSDCEVGVGSPIKTETLSETPAAVTVIDRGMIEDYNFSSISSAVQTIAGFQMYRTYFKQRIPTSRGILQDNYANKVLVMINGVPSWHGVTGEGNLDRVSIYDVERIEVLKGPASVIYGSQAYTGAINIILRQPKDSKKGEFNGQIHAGIGNKGGHSVGANHYNSSSENDWSLFTSVNEERGNRYRYNYTDESKSSSSIDDYVDNFNANALFKYKEHTFLINAFRSNEANFGVDLQNGAGNNHDVDGILLGYTYSHAWNEKAKTNLQLFYDLNERNFSRTNNDDERSNVLGYRLGGNIRNLFSIIPTKLDLEIGSDFERRKSQEYLSYQNSTNTIISDHNLADRKMDEYSGYLQLDWKPLQAWRILLGSRITENEIYGSNVSSRGTIIWTLNQQNSIKFIAGQSFRTPSFFELYFNNPKANTATGNENLVPETADTFELAYQYAKDNFYMQTLLYHSIYQDKIQRIENPSSPDANIYKNVGEFTADGLEIELKYSNPKIANFFLNLDYIYGSDGDLIPGTDHYNFKYIPKFTASAGVHKKLGNFGISLLGNYIGSTNGPEEKIDDSFIFDFNLAYQHKYKNLQLKHVISINNLSDTLVTVPEYVRRNGVNELPLEYERSIFYSLVANF